MIHPNTQQHRGKAHEREALTVQETAVRYCPYYSMILCALQAELKNNSLCRQKFYITVRCKIGYIIQHQHLAELVRIHIGMIIPPYIAHIHQQDLTVMLRQKGQHAVGVGILDEQQLLVIFHVGMHRDQCSVPSEKYTVLLLGIQEFPEINRIIHRFVQAVIDRYAGNRISPAIVIEINEIRFNPPVQALGIQGTPEIVRRMLYIVFVIGNRGKA